MKNVFLFITLLSATFIHSQDNSTDETKIKEDLTELLQNINNHYVYLEEKKVDMDCIEKKYTSKIKSITNQVSNILFFETLLNEFYDNHISLNTNVADSYRLSSPIYVELQNGKAIIKNVWQTQIEQLTHNILGAEIVSFNNVDFNQKIDEFPAVCNDKTIPEIRNWIANKIISGKYNEQRVLTLKLKNGKNILFDLDTIQLKSHKALLTAKIEHEIGIIRINNSLGNNTLISEFDIALDSLLNTKGLILDLRNANNGGNSYVAKGIMGRFINAELPYQKHQYIESFDNQTNIVRSWIELVSPRAKYYPKPVVVLVGRWTGSMGEGLAIGFDAMKRAEVVGTEMKRLAGSVYDFNFKNQNFGYKLSLEKIFHVNGIPREEFVPYNYVQQSTTKKDEILEKGIQTLNHLIQQNH